MTDKNNKWAIAGDSVGEYFNYGDFYDTKEQAIEEFKKELESGGYDAIKKQGYFWIGQCQEHALITFFNADQVIDRAWDIAQEEAGEFADEYLQDISQVAKDELDDLLVAWAEKNKLQPGFYKVINSEKVNLD